MTKQKYKNIIYYFFLVLIGVVWLLYVGPEKSFFLQDDSIHYMNLEITQGVMPLYQFFLHVIKMIVGDEKFLEVAVIIQAIIALYCTLSLVLYIKKKLQLDKFSTFVCYFALLLLYGHDYVYAFIPHQIITEALAYPIFYLYVKYVLKSIWEHKKQDTIAHFLLAVILGLTRSQLKMMLLLSVCIFFYENFKYRLQDSYKLLWIIKSICIGVFAIVIGLRIISFVDDAYQMFVRNELEKKKVLSEEMVIEEPLMEEVIEEVVEAVFEVLEPIPMINQPINSNETQLLSALSIRILYLADKEDRELFEDVQITQIFDIGYQAMDEEKANYKYIGSGLGKWRTMLSCSNTPMIMRNAVTEYMHNNPEWTSTLNYSYDEALTIILSKLFVNHFPRYIEHSLIFASHGIMASACYENEEKLGFSYFVAYLAYFVVCILLVIVAKTKKADKKTIELMIITLFFAAGFIGSVSLLLFTIKRYVSYTLGIFYMAAFLLAREVWSCHIKERVEKRWQLHKR